MMLLGMRQPHYPDTQTDNGMAFDSWLPVIQYSYRAVVTLTTKKLPFILAVQFEHAQHHMTSSHCLKLKQHLHLPSYGYCFFPLTLAIVKRKVWVCI